MGFEASAGLLGRSTEDFVAQDGRNWSAVSSCMSLGSSGFLTFRFLSYLRLSSTQLHAA